MTDDRHLFHHRSEVNVGTAAHSLFALLDDHRRLAAHMKEPSLMMAGATMRVETDALKGQAVGSLIRVTGRVLGLYLAVGEVVTERVPALRKTWETQGEPLLLAVGSHRVSFIVSTRGPFTPDGFYRLPTPAARLRSCARVDFRARLRGMVHAPHGQRCVGGNDRRSRPVTCPSKVR